VKPFDEVDRNGLARVDEWILARLDAAIDECDRALGPLWPTTPAVSLDERVWRSEERYAGLRLNEYAETARRFVWSELADWYVEAVKGRLDTSGPDRDAARAVLVHAFDQALRLLHPIVPFVTESLWQRLPGRASGEFLIRAAWPTRARTEVASAAEEFELVREAVLAIRQIRGDNNVPPGKVIDVFIRRATGDGRRATGDDGGSERHLRAEVGHLAVAGQEATLLNDESQTISRLARANVQLVATAPTGAAAHAVITGGTEIVVPLAGLIDVERECARLRTEVADLDKQITSRDQRLSNPKYLERAPQQVVANDRAILDEMKAKRSQLADKVQALCGG
jgi:valyl-tRNA synthetase